MMVQYIEFFITSHNPYSTERVKFGLERLKELGTVKNWKEQEDGDETHFSINGSWTAYSTMAAMIPKKGSPEHSLISFSIEHFED